MTQGIERIPDSLGYLILNDSGAVISSGGDLENDEHTADKLMNLVHSAVKLTIQPPHIHDRQPINFKKLSVVWENFLYVITISNHKVFVSKRRNNPQEPVPT